MGCPRAFPRLKYANLSYERAFGAYAANQEIDVATQHNTCAANQDTAEHGKTSVLPIRSEEIKQWRRDYPRSDALVLRAAPASIIEYRLKNCLTLSASSMPPLGFQHVTHRMNIPHEHASYINFTLYNEQNRRQGNVHRPPAGNPLLTMLMCSDGNYNHANPSRNGRGRSQSVLSVIQPANAWRRGHRPGHHNQAPATHNERRREQWPEHHDNPPL
jgi:hypothetical protein